MNGRYRTFTARSARVTSRVSGSADPTTESAERDDELTRTNASL